MFTDLTLVCGGRQFKVHKLVLYGQSKVFKTLLGSGFKEGSANTIELHEDDPEALDILIKFMYRRPTDLSPPRYNVQPMTFAVKVYALADKYAVKPLCAQVSTRIDFFLNTRLRRRNSELTPPGRLPRASPSSSTRSRTWTTSSPPSAPSTSPPRNRTASSPTS